MENIPSAIHQYKSLVITRLPFGETYLEHLVCTVPWFVIVEKAFKYPGLTCGLT